MTQAQLERAKNAQNLIQETDDYSIFEFLPHNRPVVQSHVIRLAQSMHDRPHLRPARPILCNEKMQIIDGQHRLRGSELNGQSVFFMVVKGLTIEDARLLNALQRTWAILDYAYSYASSKVPAYVQFVKNYEAHKLPPSVVLEAMAGRKAVDPFRLGQLQAVDQAALDERLGQLEEVLVHFPKTATPYIVGVAWLAVSKAEAYSHERMMRKLVSAGAEAQPDRVGYIRELERIYNADVPFNGPSYVRFF